MAKEIKVHITDPVGLYATPATELVKAIKVFNCQVNLHYEDKTVNMKSIMGVMSLGIPTQSEITVSCEGEDEDVAVKTIEDVLRAQKVIA